MNFMCVTKGIGTWGMQSDDIPGVLAFQTTKIKSVKMNSIILTSSASN